MKFPPPEAPSIQRVVNDSYWHEIPREGYHRNIAIEGYAAFIWAAEARADRPAELDVRAVHLGDNLVQVAAHAKGRSSSFMINQFCRKDAAIQIATDSTLFEVWVPSKGNPADRPSSQLGIRSGRAVASRALSEHRIATEAAASDEQRSESRSIVHKELPPPLLPPRASVYVFVHMCLVIGVWGICNIGSKLSAPLRAIGLSLTVSRSSLMLRTILWRTCFPRA